MTDTEAAGLSEVAELLTLQRSMRRIAHAMEVHSRRIDREMGLTLPQLAVLSCIGNLGEVTNRAIAREASLSPPTVVGILDKLEAKGMIERQRSRADRRIVHARMTEAGRRAVMNAPAPAGEEFRRRFLGLDVQRRAGIVEAFATVADLLDTVSPDPAGEPDQGAPGETGVE